VESTVRDADFFVGRHQEQLRLSKLIDDVGCGRVPHGAAHVQGSGQIGKTALAHAMARRCRTFENVYAVMLDVSDPYGYDFVEVLARLRREFLRVAPEVDFAAFDLVLAVFEAKFRSVAHGHSSTGLFAPRELMEEAALEAMGQDFDGVLRELGRVGVEVGKGAAITSAALLKSAATVGDLLFQALLGGAALAVGGMALRYLIRGAFQRAARRKLLDSSRSVKRLVALGGRASYSDFRQLLPQAFAECVNRKLALLPTGCITISIDSAEHLEARNVHHPASIIVGPIVATFLSVERSALFSYSSSANWIQHSENVGAPPLPVDVNHMELIDLAVPEVVGDVAGLLGCPEEEVRQALEAAWGELPARVAASRIAAWWEDQTAERMRAG
jgi:hypothetical protein